MGKPVGEHCTQEVGGGSAVASGNELPDYTSCIPEVITVIL